MFCDQLCQIWHDDERENFSPSNLLRGSYIVEPKPRPECQLGLEALDIIHSGKDASIISMLVGGNGFPSSHYDNQSANTAFDLGCSQERRDQRSWLVWNRDLAQCLADRKRGRVEG